jgi:hypothetical protein
MVAFETQLDAADADDVTFRQDGTPDLPAVHVRAIRALEILYRHAAGVIDLEPAVQA